MNHRLKYIVQETDRHGNVRVYFKRRGCAKVRIREAVGSPAFLALYARLLADTDAGTATNRSSPSARPQAGTWRGLCVGYFASPVFRTLAPSTQRTRRRVLEETWAEPLEPDSELVFGNMPIRHFVARAVKVLRDRKAIDGLPEAANARVKCISPVFAWALAEGVPGVLFNPASGVGRIASGSHGFHTWTLDDVAAFEARHPPGSKARLALAILLYTGARRSDAVRLGNQFRDGERLVFTAWKNRTRAPVEIDIPILPALARALAAGPLGRHTWIETAFGRPFTPAGFGNWFRGLCNEAGLQHCSAHGLRKAGSTRAAENGATPHQLMAMFGWTNLKQAEHYTRTAERRRLAASGMPLINAAAEHAAENESHSAKPSESHLGSTLKNNGKKAVWHSLGERNNSGKSEG